MSNHLLFAALPLLLTCSLSAQAPTQPAPDVYPTRIEVKLIEGSGAVLDDAGLRSRRGRDLGVVPELFARARAERLIDLPLATLDRWHREAQDGLRPGEQLGHLGLWFRLTAADGAAAQRLLAALRNEPRVADAYLEPVPHLPGGDLPPTTPNFGTRQGYLGAPPNGIAAAVGWSIVGGRGKGVQVTDMEVRWNVPHEDACKLGDPKVWVGNAHPGNGHHGTAVVGEMTSDRNGFGTRGIADEIGLRISSWNNGGVANAIAGGVNVSKQGDIVLLEVHYRVSGIGYMPAEYFSSNYNVIRNATARGIHITEAAGNGSVDLDGSRFNGRFIPGHPNYQDSGAIMCGATEGSQRAAASFSNRGARITANGWGRNVTTTGYGRLFNPNSDTRQQYTNSFSGTSSASPVVTGATAQVLGAVEYQDERDITIAEMRKLLRDHGTPCTGKIRNRPDVAAMLKSLGLPDGLAIKTPTVAPGGRITLELSGPAGGKYALFMSDRLQKTDFKLNRKFHLDPSRLIEVSPLSLPGGKNTVSFTVPNLRSLKDKDFRFQGLSVDANGRNLHVSSSGEIWIF